MTFRETILYIEQLAGTAVSVWFVCWAYRRRYELDIHLTRSEQIARWVVVAICLAITLLPGAHLQLAAIRIIGGLVGICFVAWPNLGHHALNLFHR
jgi:hypothetical protein